MVEDRFKHAKNILREPGTALHGDSILIYCRKHDNWVTMRGSERHHYFQNTARMDALAILMRTFKNLQK